MQGEKVHSVIQKLAEKEFPQPRNEQADYGVGWVISRAHRYYAYHVASLLELTMDTDKLCAKLAFWQAMNDLNEQQLGKPVRELPISHDKLS